MLFLKKRKWGERLDFLFVIPEDAADMQGLQAFTLQTYSPKNDMCFASIPYTLPINKLTRNTKKR